MSWKLQFPAGLRVVVVDDDPTCLMVLEQRLKSCQYEVTICRDAEIALKLLRDNKGGFDLVISDVHMPGMDGFGLLKQIGLEMDLPVIMLSADDSTHVVMKGVNHGACHTLIKPVCMEELKNIWQHVVRKNKDKYPLFQDDVDWSSNSKKREEEEEDDDECRLKKKKARRVNWTVDLKQQFVSAVDQLGGVDKAVPNKIVQVMNVPGLTRDNVASHLQKYRQYLRKLSGNDPLNSKKKQVNFHSPQRPLAALGNYSYSQQQLFNEIGSLSLPSSSMIMINNFNSSEMEGFVPSYDHVFNQGTTEDVSTLFLSSFQDDESNRAPVHNQYQGTTEDVSTIFLSGSSFQDDESNWAPVHNQYQGTTEDVSTIFLSGSSFQDDESNWAPVHNQYQGPTGLQSSFHASEDLMSVVLFKPNQESPFALAH